MEPESLYRAALHAANAHRDDVVSRLGPSHAAAALAEWNQGRFWLWALDRVIEHIQGERFWHECGKRNFARAGQRPRLQDAVHEIAALRRRLEGEGLLPFREKEAGMERLGQLANLLLE